MSRPVKQLLRKELTKRMSGVTSMAAVDLTRVDAVTTTEIRKRLRQKDIRITVVKNSIARSAFKELGLDSACQLLEGPTALAYGVDSEKVGVVTVVRELLEIAKETPELTVRAALLDGEFFGPERVKELSSYPTREEAIGKVVACALGSAGRLVGAITGPGAKLCSLLKAIEEKQSDQADAA